MNHMALIQLLHLQNLFKVCDERPPAGRSAAQKPACRCDT